MGRALGEALLQSLARCGLHTRHDRDVQVRAATEKNRPSKPPVWLAIRIRQRPPVVDRRFPSLSNHPDRSRVLESRCTRRRDRKRDRSQKSLLHAKELRSDRCLAPTSRARRARIRAVVPLRAMPAEESSRSASLRGRAVRSAADRAHPSSRAVVEVIALRVLLDLLQPGGSSRRAVERLFAARPSDTSAQSPRRNRRRCRERPPSRRRSSRAR
jgi:hypothetical protein